MWKWIVGLVVLAGLAGGGWYYYQNVYLPQQQAAAAPQYETYTITRGNIAATVNGTGSIQPYADVALTFRSAGRVQDVLVEEGDTVQEGQLLAQLETTDSTLALAQAKASLEIAQAQLAKLETPPDEKDILSAQAAVEVAQSSVAAADASLNAARANYGELYAATTPAQQEVNEANLRQAEINLARAQSAYDQVKDNPDVGMMPQSQELQSATLNYEVAKAQVQLTEPDPTNAQVSTSLNQIAQAELQLRQAQSNLIQAQNNLATLLEGPAQEDLDVARAQVQQAQISVLQAQNTLENAQLVAPFSGVITAVNIKPGEVGSGALAAITMSDLSQFHMNVLVDETDVRAVEIGQQVTIRVDALPDTPLTGQVTAIAPTPQDVGGVVAYQLTIVPDPTDAPLRTGMSATAVITTADVPDAVLLPNRFITLDRDSGEASVYKLVNGVPVPQAIEMGLRNERESQIVAGLTDGDTVALVTLTAAEQLQRAFENN